MLFSFHWFLGTFDLMIRLPGRLLILFQAKGVHSTCETSLSSCSYREFAPCITDGLSLTNSKVSVAASGRTANS